MNKLYGLEKSIAMKTSVKTKLQLLKYNELRLFKIYFFSKCHCNNIFIVPTAKQ